MTIFLMLSHRLLRDPFLYHFRYIVIHRTKVWDAEKQTFLMFLFLAKAYGRRFTVEDHLVLPTLSLFGCFCYGTLLYSQLYSPIYMVAEIRKTTEKERNKPCYCTND